MILSFLPLEVGFINEATSQALLSLVEDHGLAWCDTPNLVFEVNQGLISP